MNRQELQEIILEEKGMYVPDNYRFQKFTHQKRYMIWRYLSYFRKAQYWKGELSNPNCGQVQKLIGRLAWRYYLRKKNIFGEKSGVEIANHCKLGRRIDIWHGNVIINANLGDDCIIHGNNVLGNKGDTKANEIPTLGRHVDVGVGAVIIGSISITDDCRIGANAVVIRSCDVPGSTIVGVPAEVKGK